MANETWTGRQKNWAPYPLSRNLTRTRITPAPGAPLAPSPWAAPPRSPVHALHPEVCGLRTRIRRLVRVPRASPWRKGKRKSGRPEGPMLPLRRCATKCQPCLIQLGKKRKHIAFRCASPLPDFIHGAALAQLWGTHTPASHVPPPHPPYIVHVVRHAPPPPAHPTVVSWLLRASANGEQDAQRLSHWLSADGWCRGAHALGAYLGFRAPLPLTEPKLSRHVQGRVQSAPRYQAGRVAARLTNGMHHTGCRSTCSCLCSPFRSSFRPTPRSAPQYRSSPLLTEGGGPAA